MPTEESENYRSFIGRLQKEEQRPAALNEIKNLLEVKPAGEVTTTLRDVGISEIVQCLNAGNA